MKVVAAVAIGVACVACTSNANGTPPAPTSTVPTVGGNPLDMAHAAARPCTLLRPDQLAQFHLGAKGTTAQLATGTPGDAVIGCAWSPSPANLPSYHAGVDIRGGIAALYRNRSRMAIFQPTSVSEYPAVHTANGSTAMRHGQCTVDVGVANDTLIVVQVMVPDPTSLDYADPCPAADSFAAAVVANAEGAAP